MSSSAMSRPAVCKADSPQCVAVRDLGNRLEPIEVCDTKRPAQAPLAFTRSEWSAFLDAVKAGEFDDLTQNWVIAGELATTS